MASLQKHRVGGHTYWRIVESRRINGKPRPVPVLWLGTADQLLGRLQSAGADGEPIRVRSMQHGDVAALKAMADRLGVAQLIDAQVAPGRHRPSVGISLVLAALNRAVRPRSKRGWSDWASETSVAHLYGLGHPERLTSQFFWDQMDRVSEDALEAIEGELVRKVVAEFHLSLDTLLYDATNFFTYIASTNSKPKLPQRGHSKQKRTDLRQVSLSVLCSREAQIPLCTHVYAGNVADATEFSESLPRIQARLERLLGERVNQVTMVFDMGNNSRENQAQVDAAPFHYVGALPPSAYPTLRSIPLTEHVVIESGALAGIPVHRCRRLIWGAERTLVLYRSEMLREGQMRGLKQHLSKRLKALKSWRQQLEKPNSGPRSPESAARKTASFSSGQYMRDVLQVEYDPKLKGGDRLKWSVNIEEIQRLDQEVFGKRILMTDRHDWTTEEILCAYRNQHEVEGVFRQIKDPFHLAVRPQFHWTDQKLRVHIFICLLAYILARLVYHEARAKSEWTGTLSGLLDHLGKTRLAMVLRAPAKTGAKVRCQWVLEEERPGNAVFEKLVPGTAPFVYTRNLS